MKTFNRLKSVKPTTWMIIILVLLIYIVGFLSVRYIWQIFHKINSISEQKIESTVTKFDKDLIKEIHNKLENKK